MWPSPHDWTAWGDFALLHNPARYGYSFGARASHENDFKKSKLCCARPAGRVRGRQVDGQVLRRTCAVHPPAAPKFGEFDNWMLPLCCVVCRMNCLRSVVTKLNAKLYKVTGSFLLKTCSLVRSVTRSGKWERFSVSEVYSSTSEVTGVVRCQKTVCSVETSFKKWSFFCSKCHKSRVEFSRVVFFSKWWGAQLGAVYRAAPDSESHYSWSQKQRRARIPNVIVRS